MKKLSLSILLGRLSVVILSLILFSCNQPKETRGTGETSFGASVIEGDLGLKIDSLLREETKIGFSGSVSVIVDNNPILTKGYGWSDSLKKTPITPMTKFYLASTTKGITGIAAVIAQNEGYLSLSKPIINLDNDCPDFLAESTLHELLTHQSGLTGKYKTFGFTSIYENMQYIYSIPSTERGNFRYVGSGFWLSSALIEKSTGMSYEGFVDSLVFKPLGMEYTGFWFEEEQQNPLSIAGKKSKFPPGEDEPNWGFRGSGGVVTNILDFQKMALALGNDSFLNEDSWDEVFGPHLHLGSIGVGYGWFTTTTDRGTTEVWSRGGESFGHNGAIRWFKDEGVKIVILTNCGQIEEGDYEANKTVSDKIESIIF